MVVKELNECQHAIIMEERKTHKNVGTTVFSPHRRQGLQKLCFHYKNSVSIMFCVVPVGVI